ncbi:hypothetical protein KXW36_009492, partial [Aspergillus fumigatus]
GRVAVTTFASNVARVKAVADAARAADREVVVVGRAMERVVQVARECGYLNGVQNFRGMDMYGHFPQDKVLAICTGSQGEPRINYRGDSDAHIVRGLVAIVLTLFSGHTPKEILDTDALAVFEEFGFREHLTPQRSNGLRSMVERIKTDAREALAAA